MIFTPFHNGIRSFNSNSQIFLTFDDGPDITSTPAVLNLLAKSGAKATFFVVAERAKRNPLLLKEIVKAGHAVGNHSRDHGYRAFFASDNVLKKWIVESEDALSQILGQKSVGFRPPAGVVTPPLVRVLRQLKLPMYLWSHRFFDSTLGFQPLLAKRSIRTICGGEIVLLHDAQKSSRLPVFLKTLEFYLEEVKNRGYSFDHLERINI